MNESLIKFDEWIKQKIKNDLIIPALSICIFNDTDILYEYQYGVTDIKTKQNITKNHRFCIASCSKSILCTTIFKLIEKKIIPNIYDMYITDIIKSDNIHIDYKYVTVADLANHTSGIGHDTDLMIEYNKYKSINEDLDLKSNSGNLLARKLFTERILSKKPATKPKTEWQYSNYGYCVLAHILELFTKKSYEESIQTMIFDELDMKSATFKINVDDNYVHGHIRKIQGDIIIGSETKKIKSKYLKVIRNETFSDPTYLKPSGGIWLTPSDSVKYLQEYLKCFNNKSNFINQNIINNICQTSNTNTNLYSFGWKTENNCNVMTHGGGWYNMATAFYINKIDNIGFVCNINYSGQNSVITKINEKIFKYIIKPEPKPNIITKKIYLIRHGQTQWNTEKRAQGYEGDSELTDLGKEQALLTGKYLNDYRSKTPFDAIFSSPQKRALDTANIIKEQINFKNDIIILDDLREHKSGKLSGTTKAERLNDPTFAKHIKLQEKFAVIKDPIKKMKHYINIDKHVVELGGESYKDGIKRVKTVLNHILGTEYKKIIIITHSGTISEMLFYITKYGGNNAGSNCAISYIEYKDNEYEIITMPNTDHLNIVK